MCNPLTIIMIKWCLTPFLGIFIQQSHKVFFIFFYSYSKYIYYFQITLFFFVYERIWSHYFFVFMYQWIFGMFLSSYGCTIINNNDKEKAVFFLNKLLFIILFIIVFLLNRTELNFWSGSGSVHQISVQVQVRFGSIMWCYILYLKKVLL